jgi:hypothetical protein
MEIAQDIILGLVLQLHLGLVPAGPVVAVAGALLVAEHRPQPGRGQGLAAVRTSGHQKQCGTRRVRSLREQLGLHQPRDVDIQRHPPFLVALADDRRSSVGRCRRHGRPSPGPPPTATGENSINPAIAWSRSVRKLPSSAAVSA